MNYDSLADLYKLQYANYRDDIAFYARLAERLGASRILELGAGGGRVSVPLARRGFEVTALEKSPKMLKVAREYATAENVALEFVCADVRDFDLGQKFPLIIAPFNMLMHLYTFSDQDTALSCIKRHLETGGVLAFDLYQPNFGLEGVLRHEGETFVLQGGTRLDVFLHQRIDRVAQMCYTSYYCDTIQPSGAVSRQVLQLEQRYFTRFELERWLAGFRLEWAGDFVGGRLEERSSHLVGIAYG
jgi:SAM-dependent methyltransferase